MYRQIQITPEQHALQRILWSFVVNKSIDTYELTTFTYGTAVASFLVIRCLNKLASEYEKTDPKIAIIIRQNFYVDDLLTGSDSIEETAALAKRLKEVLSTACFNLRKCVSNNHEVINDIVSSQQASHLVNLSSDKQVKTLGLFWQSNLDTLKYSTNILQNTNSRRNISNFRPT